MISGDYKFVVALNKSLESGVVLNAASHMALGLSARATKEEREKMGFISFYDADNNEHASISGLSLIVLRATNGEIKKLIEAARANNILFVDFTSTMTGGTYIEQLEKTKSVAAADLVYYGVALFAKKEVLDPLTKKLSLWR